MTTEHKKAIGSKTPQTGVPAISLPFIPTVGLMCAAWSSGVRAYWGALGIKIP